MKKVIKLRTADGQTVRVMLDNWGGGIDRLHRRWMLQPEGGIAWTMARSRKPRARSYPAR